MKTLQKIGMVLAILALALAVLYLSGGMDDPIGKAVQSWEKIVGHGGA